MAASTHARRPERAGILLEVMRDLLYQTFVRKARLLQAMTFRRFVVAATARTTNRAPDPARQPANTRALRNRRVLAAVLAPGARPP